MICPNMWRNQWRRTNHKWKKQRYHMRKMYHVHPVDLTSFARTCHEIRLTFTCLWLITHVLINMTLRLRSQVFDLVIFSIKWNLDVVRGSHIATHVCLSLIFHYQETKPSMTNFIILIRMFTVKFLVINFIIVHEWRRFSDIFFLLDLIQEGNLKFLLEREFECKNSKVNFSQKFSNIEEDLTEICDM